jgi:hypothetical protein
MSLRLPGFSAVRSLIQTTSGNYRPAAPVEQSWPGVRLAQDTCQQCWGPCMDSCRQSGQLARLCVAECRGECGCQPRPTGTGGGGGSAPLRTCTSGEICTTSTGQLICDCPAGRTCGSICTTTRRDVVRPELCLFIPFPFCLMPQHEVTTLCTTDSFCR